LPAAGRLPRDVAGGLPAFIVVPIYTSIAALAAYQRSRSPVIGPLRVVEAGRRREAPLVLNGADRWNGQARSGGCLSPSAVSISAERLAGMRRGCADLEQT